MWTPQFLGLAFGAILIVIAILGGGVEIKEIKIPPLSLLTRAAIASFGIILMGLSYFVGSALPSAKEERAASDNRVTAAPPSTRPITISDHLAPAQESESFDIFIDGRLVGTVSVDRHRPVDSIQFPDSTRRAAYQITGTQRMAESRETIEVNGDGTIDLRPGANFRVDGNIQTRKVWLSVVG